MEKRSTFTLTPPQSKPVEVVLIEREDGSVVARTVDELKAAETPKEPA